MWTKLQCYIQNEKREETTIQWVLESDHESLPLSYSQFMWLWDEGNRLWYEMGW